MNTEKIRELLPDLTDSELEVQLIDALDEIDKLTERQRWIDEVPLPQHPEDETWVPKYLDCRHELKSIEKRTKEACKKEAIKLYEEGKIISGLNSLLQAINTAEVT